MYSGKYSLLIAAKQILMCTDTRLIRAHPRAGKTAWPYSYLCRECHRLHKPHRSHMISGIFLHPLAHLLHSWKQDCSYTRLRLPSPCKIHDNPTLTHNLPSEVLLCTEHSHWQFWMQGRTLAIPGRSRNFVWQRQCHGLQEIWSNAQLCLTVFSSINNIQISMISIHICQWPQHDAQPPAGKNLHGDGLCSEELRSWIQDFGARKSVRTQVNTVRIKRESCWEF